MPDAHLIQVRTRLKSEMETLRQRLLKMETAVKGLDAAIELTETFENSQKDWKSKTEEAGENDNVMELIKNEAMAYEGRIRAPEFAAYLETKFPGRTFVKSTVSHALRQTVEQGLLVLVEKGQGKRSSVYRSAFCPDEE